MTARTEPHVRISLVHVNDLHAHYGPDGGSPVARAVGFKERVAAEQPNVVFINAGDDYEKGSVAENFSEGRATLEITHAAGYDIRALGNHDFAWDEAQVLEFVDAPHGDVVCANVRYVGQHKRPWRAERLVTRTFEGVTVGFFGCVSGPWDENNERVDGDFYPAFPMRTDYHALVGELLAEARETCDVLVMVSHLGLKTDRALCEAHPEIDVVVSAHSHDLLMQPERVGGARIVQTGRFGRFIGRLDLCVDPASRRIVDEDYTMAPLAEGSAPIDAATQAKIEAIFAEHAPMATVPVAETSRALTEHETIALTARAAVTMTDAEAALLHPRSWWCGLPEGPVHAQHFCDACKVERQPAGTPSWTGLYVVTMDGADLAAAMESLVYAGPRPEADRTYRVAAPKYVALHPARYLPASESVRDAASLVEGWRLLFDYARHRTERGLYLDCDAPLPAATLEPHRGAPERRSRASA